MGGPFSAHSADLHTLWKVKRAGKSCGSRAPSTSLMTDIYTGNGVRCGSARANFGTTFCLRPTKDQGHTPTSSKLSLKPYPMCGTSKSSAHVQTGGEDCCVAKLLGPDSACLGCRHHRWGGGRT